MKNPTDVVIASAARTPVGAFNGSLGTIQQMNMVGTWNTQDIDGAMWGPGE